MVTVSNRCSMVKEGSFHPLMVRSGTDTDTGAA
jgi:hypothetical protein